MEIGKINKKEAEKSKRNFMPSLKHKVSFHNRSLMEKKRVNLGESC